MSREIFVAGVGIVSPAVLTADATWRALLAGTRCVRAAPDLQCGFDVPIVAARVTESSGHAVRAVGGGADSANRANGAEERDPDGRTVPASQMRGSTEGGDGTRSVPATEGGARRVAATQGDRMCALALAAAQEAIGGDVAAFRASLSDLRLGISIGTSKGGIQQFGRIARAFHECRSRRQAPRAPDGHGNDPGKSDRVGTLPSPFADAHALAEIPPDSAARAVAQLLGVPACVHASVAACTTGTLAVIRGAQLIDDGEADVVLCGGADASLHPLWLAAFEQMGALAPPHPELGPAYACQPYDRGRRGFVVGEGAGVLLLASERALRVCGRKPLARISGWAMATDPAGLTQLTESGTALADVVRLACRRAKVDPTSLACIHAHGTGTLANDLTEARAFAAVLGERVSQVPVVSVKGAIGHLLGAAGAVELALAALTCCQRRCFGNLTLVETDPACGRLMLPREAFEVAAGPVIKTSMGFGGHVAAVVMEAV